MMELTAADRLKIHLLLYYPSVKMKHVELSDTPGFLRCNPYGLIDIRGAGYGSGNPKLRLWNELHSHFTDKVSVIKSKNGFPTLIEWNGMIYHLDQTRSFTHTARRNKPNRTPRKGVNRSGYGERSARR